MNENLATTNGAQRLTDTVTIDRETLTDLAGAYIYTDFHVIENRDGTFDLVRNYDGTPLCFFHRLPLEAVSAIICRADDNTWGLLDELLVSESLEGYEYEYEPESADDNRTEDDDLEESESEPADTHLHVETDLRYLRGAGADYLNDPGYLRFLKNHTQEIAVPAIADFNRRFPDAPSKPDSGIITNNGEQLGLYGGKPERAIAVYRLSINQTGALDLHFARAEQAADGLNA
jgi:hypothetical protein